MQAERLRATNTVHAMIGHTRGIGIGLLAAFVLAGCGGSGGAPAPLPGGAPPSHRKSGSSPIQHVVVMIQENRTFNDFFATFPGATGSTTGYELVKSGSTYTKQKITLTEGKLELRGNGNLVHTYGAWLTGYQSGAMD